MEPRLSWDETLACLRASLADARANARTFGARARSGPSLLSARSWDELAAIEARLARDLEDTIRLELREAPETLATRLRGLVRSARQLFQSEAALVRALYDEALHHPVEDWRAAAPQLEASLWPFFSSRTRHLVNALALALDEPQPHPPIFWHPRERSFRE